MVNILLTVINRISYFINERLDPGKPPMERNRGCRFFFFVLFFQSNLSGFTGINALGLLHPYDSISFPSLSWLIFGMNHKSSYERILMAPTCRLVHHSPSFSLVYLGVIGTYYSLVFSFFRIL